MPRPSDIKAWEYFRMKVAENLLILATKIHSKTIMFLCVKVAFLYSRKYPNQYIEFINYLKTSEKKYE